MDGERKHRFSLPIKELTTLRTLQRQQTKHSHNRCLQNKPRNSIVAETNKEGLETHCFCQQISELRQKEILCRRNRITSRSLGT